MDEKLLKKLLRKTQVVRWCWQSVQTKLWCVDWLNDSDDRDREFRYITEGTEYNMDVGVYLYHEVRKQLKLIAIIDKDGIHEC